MKFTSKFLLILVLANSSAFCSSRLLSLYESLDMVVSKRVPTVLLKSNLTSFSTQKRFFSTSNPRGTIESESDVQVYSVPTYDATFKHMLSNPKTCLSFLKTFTLDHKIEAIEKLDEHLRPVQRYQDAQSLINDSRSKELMKRISGLTEKGTAIDVNYLGKEKQNSIANGSWFLTELSKIYADVISSFPTPERNSTVDVLCRLSTGAYALVEVQVVEQDYWDQRALAYASSVYSRQMKQGDKWDKISKVICINILGGGLRSTRWDSSTTFKHLKFKDQENTPIDGGIEILQYPLYHSSTLKEAVKATVDKNQQHALKEWIDLLEHGSKKKTEDVSKLRTEGIKEAYEMIKTTSLPNVVKEANEKQDEEIFKKSENVIARKQAKARDEGREEGEHKKAIAIALEMIKANLAIDLIHQMTKLPVSTIETLKKDLSPD